MAAWWSLRSSADGKICPSAFSMLPPNSHRRVLKDLSLGLDVGWSAPHCHCAREMMYKTTYGSSRSAGIGLGNLKPWLASKMRLHPVCLWPVHDLSERSETWCSSGSWPFAPVATKGCLLHAPCYRTLPDTIILYTDEHFDTSGILSVFPIAFCKGLTSILQQKANTTRAFVHCNNLSAPVSTFERRQTMLKPVCTTVSWMYAWATERRTWPKRSSRRSAADAVLELLPYYPLLFSIVFLWIRRCFRRTWWHWSLTTRSALQWT